MTSLFSRLQKLNKEATKTPWEWEYAGAFGKMGEAEIYGEVLSHDEGDYVGLTSASDNEEGAEKNAALIVECRNSLPAVLNLIEATVGLDDVIQWIAAEYPAAMVAMPTDLFRRIGTAGEAVAVFVSGQEEPKGGASDPRPDPRTHPEYWTE